MTDSNSARERAIQHLTIYLERRGQSQILMLLFTAVATLSGVLASVCLHAAGMNSMAIRYPLAVGIAYLVFLLELSFFVSHHRVTRKNSVDDSVPLLTADVSGIPQSIPIGGGRSPVTLSEKPSGGGFDIGGINGDGIVVILLIIAAIVTTVMTNLFMIYQAPALLAEVLFDGVLFFGIAKRVNRMTTQNWVSGVMRRTFFPILLVVICYSAIGIGLQSIAPKATTMAEAFHVTHQR